MIELVGRIITWLVVDVVVEWIFGGVLKFVHSVGVRSYSFFAGTRKVPVAELRLMYRELVLPWLIGFLVCGALLYFGAAWVINHT